MANDAISTDRRDIKKITPMSTFYKQRKVLFTKLINAGTDDPGAGMAIDLATLRPQAYGTKRVGRPRHNWVIETTKLFWDKCLRPSYPQLGQLNLNKTEHINAIRTTAAKTTTHTLKDL